MSKKRKRAQAAIEKCLHCELVLAINRHAEEYGTAQASGERQHAFAYVATAIAENMAELVSNSCGGDVALLQRLAVSAQTMFSQELTAAFTKKWGRPLFIMHYTPTPAEPQEEPASGERKH